MHRDTKLGLALAILVMGFAAALCFPRVSDETPQELVLQTGSELDSGIRLGQVKIHTDADRPKPRIDSASPVTSDEPIPTVATETDVLPVASIPEPIAGLGRSEPTPIEPAKLPPDVVAEPEPPVVHQRIYVTQPGDTLSGIAEKELGSSSKYQEILDANRETLTNPDSLPTNMSLVIPIPEADEFSPASPASSPVVTAPSVETPDRPTPPAPTQASPRTRFSGKPKRIGSSAEPRLQ